MLKRSLLLAITLACFPVSIFAQQPSEDFYGAPAPADFPQELGTPVDDDAAALAVPEEKLSEGNFEDTPFTFSFAIREGYDDNLFTTETDRSESFYTNMAGGANYTAESSRLQLSAALNGGVTYYYTRPGNKFDYTGAINIQGSYEDRKSVV